MSREETDATLSLEHRGDQLWLVLGGCWSCGQKLPATESVAEALAQKPTQLAFDAAALVNWDSAVLLWVRKVEELAQAQDVPVDRQSLPESIRKLIDMSGSAPVANDGRKEHEREFFISKLGVTSIRFWNATVEAVSFIGSATQAVGKFLTGRAVVRWRDFWAILQSTGAEALAIVSLIAFLVGLILAFVGAEQLRFFGATLYVADMVGIAMVREMGAMMTAIIVCGRTGAAFAAQLGSMKTTEEIDALTTTGIDPMQFLVAPRIVALSLMMPLLTLYANFVGILGGFAVGLGLFDLTFTQYMHRTMIAISLPNFFIGIIKASVFGVIVAVTGCLRGMQCGSSSSAVGVAATSAVVTGITWIIIADAIFAVILSVIQFG